MNFLIKIRTTKLKSQNDNGIIWIDPNGVDKFCGSKWPHCHMTDNFWIRRICELNPAFSFLQLGGEWDVNSIPIVDVEKYIRMKDFVENMMSFEESIWYKNLVEFYVQNGFAAHKKIFMYSVDDIKSFFVNYAVPLAKSLSTSGYKFKIGDEIGSIAIDRHGAIHKAGSGTHRFFLSKILGVSSVPVQVTFVHTEWLRKEGLTLKRSDRGRILERIRQNISGSAVETGMNGASVPPFATMSNPRQPGAIQI